MLCCAANKTCPDISRDGIAAPGGLEPETASGVKA